MSLCSLGRYGSLSLVFKVYLRLELITAKKAREEDEFSKSAFTQMDSCGNISIATLYKVIQQ